jgi:zinc protease
MKRFHKARALALFGLILLGITSTAVRASAQEAAPPQKVITIEGITEYRLANGLRFLSFPDPSSSTVTINMTVLVGSRMEGYGETGMAHLLEHMLFKGSKNYPHVDKAMQEHGAQFNGTTWVDRTNYFETMPATDENLEFGIKLEADRLVNCFIKREDLATEMTVVRNEFEMGENSPERILNQRMMAIAYEWHNYGKSTIGNRADIERVPIDNLQAFYKRYYQPDNVVLIIAGKFDPARALALVNDTFGALKVPARKLDQTYTEEPAQDGERSVILRRVGKVAVVGLMYHIPAAAHEDFAAVDVLSSILGDSPGGRLYKMLVQSKKATKVSADTSAWHDPSILEMIALVNDPTVPQDVLDSMASVAEDFAKNPATAKEVERAQQQYQSQFARALTKSTAIAQMLSESAAAGDWRLLFWQRDRIAKVTPADVDRVAAKYLRSSNRTAGMFIPAGQVARTPIPEAPPATEVVKDYKGGKGLTAGEAFDPTPENLEKRIVRKELSSGIRVAFLPKKTRGEAVVGSITLRFGNSQSLTGLETASEFLGPLMMRGTKARTRQDIDDTLDALESKLSASSGVGQLSFSLTSKRAQLPKVLDLLREVLREPTFPADEFQILQENDKQELLKSQVEPQALAINLLRRTIRPYPKEDVRYVPTVQESIARLDKVTRDQVERLYANQLGGSYGEIALVGDFDIEATTKQLDAIFAGWKSPVAYERIGHAYFAKVKGGVNTVETPDKENAVYIAGQMFAMKDTDPEYAALKLGNYVLGTGFTSRLIERLRQKEGWSYGAGSMLNIGSQDQVSTITIFAIANPKNMEKVTKGTAEEVAKILQTGVTSEELEAAKKGYLESLKTARGSDAKLAASMRENLYLQRTFAYEADLEKQIAGLTVPEVNRALNQHLSLERLVIIRAGDFLKNAAPAPMK